MRAVGLVDSLDGDGALLAALVRVGDRRTEEHLVVAMVHRWVHHLGDVEPLGEEADAPVDLAQALLAVQVVAVLGAVAVLRGPRDGLDDLRPFVVEQREQLGAQPRITGRRQVVLAA